MVVHSSSNPTAHDNACIISRSFGASGASIVHRIRQADLGAAVRGKKRYGSHLAAQLKDHSARRTLYLIVDAASGGQRHSETPKPDYPVDRKKMAVVPGAAAMP